MQTGQTFTWRGLEFTFLSQGNQVYINEVAPCNLCSSALALACSPVGLRGRTLIGRGFFGEQSPGEAQLLSSLGCYMARGNKLSLHLPSKPSGGPRYTSSCPHTLMVYSQAPQQLPQCSGGSGCTPQQRNQGKNCPGLHLNPRLSGPRHQCSPVKRDSSPNTCT